MPRAFLRTICTLAAIGGCAQSPPPQAETPAEKPPITIAVLGFGGSATSASPAEDGCVMALLEGGYRLVERPRVVAAVPNENDVDYAAVGRALGADLIVDGGWTRDSGEPPRRLESRLISTHSANVLGTIEGRGHTGMGRAAGHKLCSALLSQLP